MSELQLTVRPDYVAVLTLDQPGSKANVLTAAMWSELEAAVDSLLTRSDIAALVLASAKPDIFIAGADLNLLANASGPNDSSVRSFIEHGLRVLAKLEQLPFPTIAAIDGAALGGGLEVALACDYRIGGFNPKLRVGLPEVSLGLIPGWGGTQRLPRIIGVEPAIEMVVSGQPIDCQRALANGLFDGVLEAPGNLLEAAAAFVLKHSRGNARRTQKQQPVAHSVQPALGVDSGAAAAARRVVMEGSKLPLEEGLKLETEAFMQLAGSDESRRLIGAFFASRRK
jgi:enoyl-CoA hydratase/carnithine racemase